MFYFFFKKTKYQADDTEKMYKKIFQMFSIRLEPF